MQRMNTYLPLIQPQSYRVPRKQPSGWQLRTTKQSSHIKAHINQYNCVCLYINSTLVDLHEAALQISEECFPVLLHFCTFARPSSAETSKYKVGSFGSGDASSQLLLFTCGFVNKKKQNKVLCCVIPGPLLWKDNLLSNCNLSWISS